MHVLSETSIRRALSSFCHFLALACVVAAPAAAQPSIRDWGSPPGTPPPYTTPDIWVQDGNGNHVNPQVGAHNSLVAQITNQGDQPAKGVKVTFAFAPFGTWPGGFQWHAYGDFEEIPGLVKPIDFAPGETKTVGVDWYLDPSDSNGGQWSHQTVSAFNHFCVWVKVQYGNQTQDARRNFVNISTSPGQSAEIKFLVPNTGDKEAVAELVIAGLPEAWKPRLDGAPLGRRFPLKARELRPVILSFTVPERARRRPVDRAIVPDATTAGQPDPGPLDRRVDVSLELDGQVVGGLTFDVAVDSQPIAAWPAGGGDLSALLAGAWDLRGKRRSALEIVNPTPRPLLALVVFFDRGGAPLRCLHRRLTPDELLEIDVERELGRRVGGAGEVKVISLDEAGKRLVPGLVGYQLSFARCLFGHSSLRAETVMQPVPAELLQGEIATLKKLCN
jgi:hypothetical protein